MLVVAVKDIFLDKSINQSISEWWRSHLSGICSSSSTISFLVSSLISSFWSSSSSTYSSLISLSWPRSNSLRTSLAKASLWACCNLCKRCCSSCYKNIRVIACKYKLYVNNLLRNNMIKNEWNLIYQCFVILFREI